MAVTWAEVTSLIQILLIDVSLAGDNAIVIGLAVQGLVAGQKRRAIAVGVGLAAFIRIILALVATKLLTVIGLTLAGGLLLLWVCWKMFRELRVSEPEMGVIAPSKKLFSVIFKIVIADLSMSLDNVLAVAGAAIGHPYLLALGLLLSILLMGFCAAAMAKLLERYRWIAWVGLIVIFYVAIRLIIIGGLEVSVVIGHFIGR